MGLEGLNTPCRAGGKFVLRVLGGTISNSSKVSPMIRSFIRILILTWLGSCLMPAVLAFRNALSSGLPSALLRGLVLAWPVNPLWDRVYSPYQLLEIGRNPAGLTLIRAAGHYYQDIYDFSGQVVSPGLIKTR
jgi:hypothetical protein